MALLCAEFVDDPTLLAQAKDEFASSTDGYSYKAAISDGAEPPKPHI